MDFVIRVSGAEVGFGMFTYKFAFLALGAPQAAQYLLPLDGSGENTRTRGRGSWWRAGQALRGTPP